MEPLTINIDNHTPIEIDSKFQSMVNDISEASKMLTYEKGWDGDAGLPIKSEVFYSAVLFVVNLTNWIYEKKNIIMDELIITPRCDGGIDVQWANYNEYELLVDIPPVGSQGAYYGTNVNDVEINDAFDLPDYKREDFLKLFL